MGPVFGLWQCLMIVMSTFADDMYDVFLKKGFVFIEVNKERLVSNADLCITRLCSAPMDYCA